MVEEIVLENRNKIYTLTTECVIHLHDLLTKNYQLIDKMDPVEPPGIKNIHSLESAVFRQHTGASGWYKYNTVFTNCSTLVFALINNHPFHNGNKRVAFLSMIKHLYENDYVISPSTKHEHIYQILLAIADNNLPNYLAQIDKKLYKQYRVKGRWSDETVIDILAQWLRKNSEFKNVTIKTKIRIQQIKAMLETKGILLEINGTWLTLYQTKKLKQMFGFMRDRVERTNIKTYGIGNSMSEVGIKVINQIRKDYSLTQKDGFDNNAFYDDDTFIDDEMLTYKKIIYKLSQT
jgi:death-on-curing family protein